MLIFIRQFRSPLIYLLLFAAVIIFIVGEDKLDAFIISIILLFNACLGTIQELRTHNIVESLQKFLTTESIVIRDGVKSIIPDKDITIGDIIVLQEGQRIAADARIISAYTLQIDEASLTGESNPVNKTTETLSEDLAMANQKNMVFKGTYILSGSGLAIVTATGIQTEIGLIHKVTKTIDTDIPLKRELDHLSYMLLLSIFLICGVLFIIGYFGGKPLEELLVMLTALFICVVPEGLPIALTLVLVTGAYHMAKQNVLVKNLQAIEALGRANVIILDKTGTLTRNEMIVTNIFSDNLMWSVTGTGYHPEGTITSKNESAHSQHNESLKYAAKAAILLSDAQISYDKHLDIFSLKGDPTQAALSIFGTKMGFKKEELDQQYKLIYEIPFCRELYYRAGFYEYKQDNEIKIIAFIAGSPEIIMKNTISDNKGKQQQALNLLLNKGLRTIAIAMKNIKKPNLVEALKKYETERDAYISLIKDTSIFLAFCGIEDSIRPEVENIITRARKADIFIVMATGDHKKTALSVAQKVGIYQQGDKNIDGIDFDQASDAELLSKLKNTTVYSRVAPKDKMRIVNLFHQAGDIVAMTGDGINDAPSLIAADLGIAMGKIGTEVAKEASDLILLDDSFSSIIEAIKQGRHIFYALKRVILYFFTTNVGEILIVFFALTVNVFYKEGLPLPITAAQILWLNLVTDGFMDVALSTEPQEKGLLDKTWLDHRHYLIDKSLLSRMIVMAIPMALGSLIIFLYYYQISLPLARTMTLITMAMFQWFNAWNCRSMNKSIFHIGMFSNKWFLLAAGFVISLQLAILYIPFMRFVFKTTPLSFSQLLLTLFIASSIVWMEELRKYIWRLYNKENSIT